MGQVTIYLDNETEARLKASAKNRGVPVSRWIAELVRERTATEWPEEVHQLAGAWPDLADVKVLRSGQGEDLPRESF
ncbi:MAG: CopG family transcriptional regulator [Halochromatium sp.]|nr:CopG family transcriptional regulator [Halochromatium sp.]